MVPEFRLIAIPDPNTALGVAARLSMSHRAFSQLSFGSWMSVLYGQVHRGHQMFVCDQSDRIVGYFGYGLTTNDVAQAWLDGLRDPSYAECVAGDCVIFNAWISEDVRVLRFMWNAARMLVQDCKAVFFKRYYDDGSVRPVRLTITAAVGGHVARAQARSLQPPR